MLKNIRSFAVTIGINNYINELPLLETAVNDARELGNILTEKYQYQVLPLLDTDATHSGLTSLLNDFAQQQLPLPDGSKVKIEADDRVLFYFGGHGIALDGLENGNGPVGYLIPQDAQRDDQNTWLCMHLLHDALLKLPCRHLLIILDCCFAGSFRWAGVSRDLMRSQTVYQERYERFICGCAQQVITSSAYDEKALDSLNCFGNRGQDEEHSPFAKLLFAGLNGEADLTKDGVITAHELYVFLDSKLRTTIQQTPGYCELKRHDKGEYIFVPTDFAVEQLPKAPVLNKKSNPYRGLEPFREVDKDLFFGRQKVIADLYAHLSQKEKPPLTVVLGASGIGKSSLVKAGLLPRLREAQWQIIGSMRPGKTPFKALARAILHIANEKTVDQQKQINLLSQKLQQMTPETFITEIEKLGNNNLVLVIDQFEELLTTCQPQLQLQFLSWLKGVLALHSEKLHVIITLRDQFEFHFSHLLLEPSEWKKARMVVPLMTQDELREVIEKPAAEKVMCFEPCSLMDDLINEVIQMPGSLPLLSFTLSELYLQYLENRGSNRAMTQEDYDNLGGVMGSLTKRATQEYKSLVKRDPAHEKTVRRVMLRMVSVEGGESMRRRVPKSELVYSLPEENKRVQDIIQGFSQARLIVEGTNSEGEPYVEPAHDALVWAWDKLMGWLIEEQANLPMQHDLTRDAKKWALNPKQAVGILWDYDPRLPQVEHVLKSDPCWLNSVELAFIKASIQKRNRTRQRQITGIVTIVMLLAVTAIVSYEAGMKAAVISYLLPVV